MIQNETLKAISNVNVKRVPVKRVSILSSKSIAAKRLLELKEASRRMDILEIVKEYNIRVARARKIEGYQVLPRQEGKKRDRVYNAFEELYEACKIKRWDFRLYLEAQFKRCSGTVAWMSGAAVPSPGNLVSVNAFKYFTNYLSTVKQVYGKDVNGGEKEKGRKAQDTRQRVIDGIVRSVESLSRYIQQSDYEDLRQYKALRIFQSWEELSPFYLYSIPWFKGLLGSDLQGKIAEEYKKEFDMVDKSAKLQDLIQKVVVQAESFHNIPGNINLG